MGNRFGGGEAPSNNQNRNTAAPLSRELSRDGQKNQYFSKEVLEFLPSNSEEPVEFIISNPKDSKLKFKFEPSPNSKCAIIASPSSGAIAPGKEKKIKLRSENKEKENCKFKLTIYLGNEPHFISVTVRTASGVFGVDPSTLDHVTDGEYSIPEVLHLLKKSLIGANGLQSEGIFRLAGEVADINETKNLLNTKQFETSTNVNTVATLIKVWFRELPTPILNELPTETIFYSNNIQSCVDSFQALSNPNKVLLSWLLDLLADTQEYKEVNRMNCQNLAIVVAPNLYDSSSSDAMESLVLSQKCVEYLKNVLQWKIDQRNCTPGTPTTKSRRLSRSGLRNRVQSTKSSSRSRGSTKSENAKKDGRKTIRGDESRPESPSAKSMDLESENPTTEETVSTTIQPTGETPITVNKSNTELDKVSEIDNKSQETIQDEVSNIENTSKETIQDEVNNIENTSQESIQDNTDSHSKTPLVSDAGVECEKTQDELEGNFGDDETSNYPSEVDTPLDKNYPIDEQDIAQEV